MTIYTAIVIFSWLIFLLYWAFSAFSAKKSVWQFSRWLAARAVLLVLVMAAFQSSRFRGTHFKIAAIPLVGFIGIVFCVCGIALAIWARHHLGRNWGMPMSVKINPELVITGPYTRVRHPIYTGILFAMLGSALAANFGWLLIFLLFLLYFLYSANNEEKIMQEQFPARYGEYMKKTKMLVPFMF